MSLVLNFSTVLPVVSVFGMNISLVKRTQATDDAIALKNSFSQQGSGLHYEGLLACIKPERVSKTQDEVADSTGQQTMPTA